MFGNKLLLGFLFISNIAIISKAESTEMETNDSGEFIGRMIEEGRTLVHHTMKRFMIILPAIFFKAGVAFTMLILVAIVAVNNGFIGFLLLAVGLGSILARLQEGSRRPAAVPYYLPAYHHHPQYHHDWDRNDKGVEQKSQNSYLQSYPSLNQQYAYAALNTHNPTYYGQSKI